jgi:hypothetical protein
MPGLGLRICSATWCVLAPSRLGRLPETARKSSSVRTRVLALLALCLILPWAAVAQSMTDQDHILYLPGHTQTVEWSEELDKLLFTCDYKNLQGVAPERGEPCGDEPRLYFSKQDLKNLKYVVFDEQKGEFIYDNSRIIERIYEKFPGVLFVMSTDRVQDYTGFPGPERGQLVDVEHPVDPELYNFYSERAGRVFEMVEQEFDAKGEPGFLLGRIVKPYQSTPYLGFDPVAMEKTGEMRPLADYGLIILPKNPDRTTIIHELLHYMIYLARARSVSDFDRLMQMGIHGGLTEYYFDRLHRKEEERIFPPSAVTESEEELTNYIIRFGQHMSEHADLSPSEEVEIRYFISKYGNELGISTFGIDVHKNSFWRYVTKYENTLGTLGSIGRGALMEPAGSFIRKNPDLIIRGRVIQNYYPFIWDNAVVLAREYPKRLLTRPLNGDGSQSFLQRFSQEFFPRPPSMVPTNYDAPL